MGKEFKVTVQFCVPAIVDCQALEHVEFLLRNIKNGLSHLAQNTWIDVVDQ